jgi:hypothetical protein
VTGLRNEKEKKLDERVGSMENLEQNVEEEELIIDAEVSLSDLIDAVELLDSVVHQKSACVGKNRIRAYNIE